MAKHIKNAIKAVATFVVVAAVAALFTMTGVGYTAAFMAIAKPMALAMTFSMALVGSMMTKSIEATQGNFGAKFASRSATAPRQLIYGECRVGGTIAHMSTTGTDNVILHMVIVLAGHEVESLQSVRLNDVDLSTSDETINGVTVKRVTNSGFVNTDNDNAFTSGSLVRFRFVDGSQTAVDPFMDAQLAAIGQNDIFTGCAYLYLQMVFDQEKFGGGMPAISCVVRGKKLYDPRTGNTTWSNNPALCIRDYISDTQYGLKALSSEINDLNSAGGFAAAANVCEQNATKADGSTETRYTANGFTNFSATGTGIIEGLLTSMAGQLTYTNGQFNIFAGAAQTPSLTITDDNLLEPISVATKPQSGELYNTVKSAFVDASNSYVATDSPVYQDSTFLTEDTPNGVTNDKPNYVKKMEIRLPFTTTHERAQRLGRIALKAQRNTKVISCLVNLEFMRLQPCDWVYVTNERLSFSAKVFEVIDMGLEIMGEDEQSFLACRLTLKETNSNIYTFAQSDYQSAVASGSDLSAGGISLAAPSGLSVVNDTMGVDILTHASITVSWTNASTPYILGTEVQFKRSGDSVYTTNFANQGATKQQITGLEVGVTYNIRVRHLGLNTGSSYVSTNHTVGGTAIAANSLKNDQISVSLATSGANQGRLTVGGIGSNNEVDINKSNLGLNYTDGATVGATAGSNLFKQDGTTVVANADFLNSDFNYASDGTGTLAAANGGTGITNFANSTHKNSNTTKADVGIDSIFDSSNRFIGSLFHGSTARTAEQLIDAHERATNAIDSSNRITGSIFDGTNTRTPANINDAYVRATTGLNASGEVQVAVPQAQLTQVVTASVNQQAFVWTELSNAGFSPSATTFTFEITWKNGAGTTVAESRWVATRDTTNDHIDNSGITNNYTAGGVSSSGVTSSVVGGDSTFMAVTFTKGGTSITVSASLITFTGFTFKE